MKSATNAFNLMVPVNNTHLCYDDVGDGNIPIIFLHGFPFSKSMWHGQMEFLKYQHRLIAVDIRGFGKSIDEESVLGIDLFADDLIAFMDALNIDQAIICGLSMGGFIALNAVKRFPKRFVALILCDTQCVADTPEIKEKRYKTIEEIKVKGVKEFNDGFLKSVFHEDSLLHKTELVEKLRRVVYGNTQHIITNGLIALAERTETCSALSDINIPTLILCGREDEVTPLEQSVHMHENIEHSILYVLDHSGHVSNLEQPHEFNKHLLHFVSSHVPTDVC